MSKDYVYIQTIKERIDDAINTYNASILDATTLEEIIHTDKVYKCAISTITNDFDLYRFTDVSLPECSINSNKSSRGYVKFKFDVDYKGIQLTNDMLEISPFSMHDTHYISKQDKDQVEILSVIVELSKYEVTMIDAQYDTTTNVCHCVVEKKIYIPTMTHLNIYEDASLSVIFKISLENLSSNEYYESISRNYISSPCNKCNDYKITTNIIGVCSGTFGEYMIISNYNNFRDCKLPTMRNKRGEGLLSINSRNNDRVYKFIHKSNLLSNTISFEICNSDISLIKVYGSSGLILCGNNEFTLYAIPHNIKECVEFRKVISSASTIYYSSNTDDYMVCINDTFIHFNLDCKITNKSLDVIKDKLIKNPDELCVKDTESYTEILELI
ncbi:MAG: hypothetical protein ACRCTZ_20515 [Sarcina sp.]